MEGEFLIGEINKQLLQNKKHLNKYTEDLLENIKKVNITTQRKEMLKDTTKLREK